MHDVHDDLSITPSAVPRTSEDSSSIEDNPPRPTKPALSNSEHFRSGILRSPSYASDSSSNTIPLSSSVTFAPLPFIKDRKRKSTIRLGVAARSRMLQQRRARRAQLHDDPDSARDLLWREPGDDLDEEEDPFVTLGNIVKDASKGLWRRISRRDVKAARAVEQDGADTQSTTGVLHGDEEVKDSMIGASFDMRKSEQVEVELNTTSPADTEERSMDIDSGDTTSSAQGSPPPVTTPAVEP